VYVGNILLRFIQMQYVHLDLGLLGVTIVVGIELFL
jgi:hypothetical protein